MSNEFTGEIVVPDLRDGHPPIKLVIEQNVVKIYGWQLVYIDLDELQRAVLDSVPKPLSRRAKDLLLRPFSWFVAALLSRDLTPNDKSDDDER